MPEHIVASNAFVIRITQESHLKILAEKFRLSERGDLIKTKEISWASKLKVEILKASCVDEILTDRQLPVIIICENSLASAKYCNCFVLCIDYKADKFIPLRKFQVKTKWLSKLGSKCHIYLIDGPAVLITYRNEVHLFENKCGTVFNIHSYVSPKRSENAVHLLTSNYQPDCDKYLLIFKITKLTEENNTDAKSQTIVALTFSQNQFAQIDSSCFIPEEYSSVCSAINVRQIKETCLEVLIGTTEGYIIMLKNKSIAKCIKMCEHLVGNAHFTCLKLSPENEGYLVTCQNQAALLDSHFNVSMFLSHFNIHFNLYYSILLIK